MKDTTNTKDFTANGASAMLAAAASMQQKNFLSKLRRIKLFVKERLSRLKNLFEKKNSSLPVKGKSYSEKLQLLKQLVGEYDLSDDKQKERLKAIMYEIIQDLKEYEIQIPIRHFDNRAVISKDLIKEIKSNGRDRKISISEL